MTTKTEADQFRELQNHSEPAVAQAATHAARARLGA